ncbi:MAG TPA: hypothetical protein VFJ85_02475 [Acidimicrobiales bacterium]|nr:hypothetical protein [Acidimicrobiales bacterium]
MLDHVLLEAIASLRRGLEASLLERHATDERFQLDMMLGDISWETSYTLPFEGVPPRVQADIAFDWTTWSQTAYRSWKVDDPGDEPPEIEIEVVLRLQRLAVQPDASTALAVLPDDGPTLLGEAFERENPVVQQQLDPATGTSQYAVEVSYVGLARLAVELLEEPRRLDEHFGPLGAWIAQCLVRLADLKLAFVPPELEEPPFPSK